MSFWQWSKREAINIIPAIIYFCLGFNLIHFTIGLSLGPDDPRYYSYLSVTISALIIGKIIIIVDAFPFIDAFPKKPMIYNIIWKLCIYNVFVMLFRLGESALDLMLKYGFSKKIWSLVYLEASSPIFWQTEILIFFLFIFFVLFREFTRVLGKQTVRKMIFG